MVQPPTSNRKPAIDEIGRQVDGDEGQLETAGEEAEHEQHVGALPERLDQRLPQRLRRSALRGRPGSPGRERERERQHQQHDHPEDHQRLLPADGVDQRHAQRRIQELAEGARGGAGAEGERAPAFRQELAESRQHDAEGAAGEAEADEDAGRNAEKKRRVGVGHQREPDGIENPAAAEHPHGAEAIGQHAGKRLARAPQDVLDREREAEHIAIPAVRLRLRRQEQAERRARPEAEHGDEAAAQHDHERRAPADCRSPGGGRQ